MSILKMTFNFKRSRTILPVIDGRAAAMTGVQNLQHLVGQCVRLDNPDT